MLRYDARMVEQPEAGSFGTVLRAAIRSARITQSALAERINTDPGQISRWVNDKSVPHVEAVKRMESVLGGSLLNAFSAAVPDYELFVSAPITGLAETEISIHHDAVAAVVEAAHRHVNNLYWPGESIRSRHDLVAADLATEHNLKVLVNCPAYLYVQFSEIVHPSSALIEFGFALAKRLKTTLILREGLTSPFMLEGFGGVAASLNFLPKARIYRVESTDRAVDFIRKNGRELLGLT